MNRLSQTQATFESIKHVDTEGREFWTARQLSQALEYSEYRHFLPAIERAKLACSQSGLVITDHFEDILDMVTIGSGGQRQVEDIKLSRYACYLIVQNGDSSKSVIANGQTYFAIQTRRQEIDDAALLESFNEDQLRLVLREQLKKHNVQLASAAREAGVITGLDFAIFQDQGYMGLYGGEKNTDIHKRKHLKPNEKILDHMGSTELAANLFRATQAADKLVREGIKGKPAANQTHYNVGRKVRQTIQELGGTMPEQLAKPMDSIQQLSKKKTKELSE
jgi:DNA-damage-inducible protein D